MTAVNWFFRWINDNPEATHKEYAEAFEQAKQMEKQQIIESYCNGCKDITDNDSIFPRETSEQYYNDTYVNKGSGDTRENSLKFLAKQSQEMGLYGTSSETEISDEDICKQAEIEYPFGDYDRDNWLRRRGFIKGMIKYREQLKKK